MIKHPRKILFLAASGILMALAWSLRGQFGHLKGALIPGAAAALIPLLWGDRRWRSSAGLALLLAPIGFAAGGHMGYGRFYEAVQRLPFHEIGPSLGQIAAVGALWGALGGSFLGMAYSEKIFKAKDLMVLGVLVLIWAGLLSFENAPDKIIFTAGIMALHFYNAVWKKSFVMILFSLGLTAVSALVFSFTAFLLRAGIQGGWPGTWWALRDQMIGFAVGAAVYIAVRFLECRDKVSALQNDSVQYHKLGILFFVFFIPLINFVHTLRYWMSFPEFAARNLYAAVFAGTVPLALILWKWAPRWTIFSIHLKKTLSQAVLFFIWFMSVLAIAKERLVFGSGRWETAYTLFIFFSLSLTLILFKMMPAEEDEAGL